MFWVVVVCCKEPTPGQASLDLQEEKKALIKSATANMLNICLMFIVL
jgi:hypothetical protein